MDYNAMFNNPLTQIGLGIMGAGGSGVSGVQQIGRGGLLGIQNYQRTMNAQELAERQRQAALLQQQELKMRQQRMLMQEQEAQREQQQFQAQQDWISKNHPELLDAPASVQKEAFARAYGAPEQQKYGNTPLLFQTEGGLKYGRFSPGGINFPEVPEGYQAVKPMSFQNLGGYTAAMPYGSNEPTGVYEHTPPPEAMPGFKKDVAEAAATGSAIGKAATEAQISLVGKEEDVLALKQKIDEIKAHPGKSMAMGKISGFLPSSRLTPDYADFESRKEQLLGETFVIQYEKLKGGGSITEVETEQAAAAMNRMGSAKSSKAFDSAADDFYNAIKRGTAKLKKLAKLGGSQPKAGTGWTIQKVE